jgi:SAM-dependent methyltransferase
MDARASRLRQALRRLRFRWNASAHYEPWLYAQIPSQAHTALDVGCGDGRIARVLAGHGLAVDALDRDQSMLDVARSGPASTVRWIHGDLLDSRSLLRPEGYDVVTVVGTLHFLRSRDGLARVRTLVASNGTLLVIGLYRATTVLDTLATICVLPLHVAMGWWQSRRAEGFARPDPRVPLKAPRESLFELRRVAAAELPGARVRRRIFWRYTLQWHNPNSDLDRLHRP